MENAILMASGMGTRMRPLTETVPKPLIKVGNIPMIETVISGLEQRGVETIAIVVGYLHSQFEYLKEKYPNVIIIENKDYETVNNISSVYAARKMLRRGECFICEADLFVSDYSIFKSSLTESCYYGKFVNGYSEDWVFDLDENGIITRIGKEGTSKYNMTGIAFFNEKDAKHLCDVIEADYGKKGFEELFWDDVVNNHISEFELTVHPVEASQIVEIDTVAELEEVCLKMKGVESFEDRKRN